MSAKGIKAGTGLTISSGVYTISTGDDGVHADDALTVSGGQIHVLKSYEGLEGSSVDISSGEIALVSSDDGVNAAGGADGSGYGNRGMENGYAPSGASHALTISGGDLNILAGGDGLDSNGSLTMTGGTVPVSSTGSADGALDYDGSFSLEGGVLLAASSGNMAQAPTDVGQYTLAVHFGSALPAGTFVQLAGADREFVFCLAAPASHIVFSSPELNNGDVYSVSYGGEYSGESAGGLCSGGTYSGGTLLTELTITDYLTTYGQVGMGGSKGGNMLGNPGQRGSFGRGGIPEQGGPRPEAPSGAGDKTKPVRTPAP